MSADAAASIPRRLREAASEEDTARRWRALTRLPEKPGFYELDPYFRLAWSDASHLLGADAAAALGGVCAVLFRSDAIAGRRIERCLQFLAGHGFAAVAALEVELDRHALLELWRYQNNAATVDRLAAVEELARTGPGLYVVLHDQSPDRRVPGAVRLRSLKGKGSGDAPGSAPTLRSEAEIVNRMLSMVHTADEPIDLVRELGIFFDAPARRRLITGFAEAKPLAQSDLEEAARTVYARVPPVEFDPRAAATRLSRALATYPRTAPWAAALNALSGEPGAGLAWAALSCDLEVEGWAVPAWDRAQVATHFITYDESDDMLILSNGETAWSADAPAPEPQPTPARAGEGR